MVVVPSTEIIAGFGLKVTFRLLFLGTSVEGDICDWMRGVVSLDVLGEAMTCGGGGNLGLQAWEI